MKKLILILASCLTFILFSFTAKSFPARLDWQSGISLIIEKLTVSSIVSSGPSNQAEKSGDVNTAVWATDFVAYAKSHIGTRYVWGSMNPEVGFDCSGFVNHVSRHFGFNVPRSSVQFTTLGTEVQLKEAKPGDIILFTGTDPSTRIVGHMGIVTENGTDGLEFVHSSSGKGKGVGTSALEGYYQKRFVKVIRIFPLKYA